MTSEKVEREAVARVICKALGRDPDQCTQGTGFASYQSDGFHGGSTCHRYAWQDYVGAAAAVEASLPTRSAIVAETVEACARVAETFPDQILMMWDRPGGPPGNGYRPANFADIAASIRSLTPTPADDGWRSDMENAPENHAVQIWVPDADYYGNDGVYAGMLVNMGTGKRWMTFGWALGRDLHADNQPLAWRPLPSPPTATEETGK